MTRGVGQWRSLVESELDRSRYPLPPELVLAVMKRESNGKTGEVNTTSGASGLMQVMPIALKDYNQHHKNKYTMSDLRSRTTAGARIQVRVGIWLLARFWRGAYNYLKKRLGNVALDDLARIADFFYAAGPGNSRKKLDKIKRPTYDAVKARYPKWDRIIPAQLVWDRVAQHGGQWDIESIDKWLEGGILIEKKKTMLGAALGLVLIAVAWWYFQKGTKK
jgi:soluble lytic murein transglycosylase-like protein